MIGILNPTSTPPEVGLGFLNPTSTPPEVGLGFSISSPRCPQIVYEYGTIRIRLSTVSSDTVNPKFGNLIPIHVEAPGAPQRVHASPSPWEAPDERGL